MTDFKIHTDFPEIDEIFENICKMAYDYVLSENISELDYHKLSNHIDSIFNDKFVDAIYDSFSEEELSDMLVIELTDDYDDDTMIIYDNIYDFVENYYPSIGNTVADNF